MTDPTTYQDRELVAMIHAGQTDAEKAFRVLYNRYVKRLYLYCLKIMGSQATARDIVQDVFLKFLIKVREGEIIESTPAYLMTIARNLCLNQRRNGRIEYMDLENIMPATEDHPYETKDIHAHLQTAMAALPTAYRETLILQIYGGLSYAEICEVTGETLPVVRHRISRAKQKLRTLLLPILEH